MNMQDHCICMNTNEPATEFVKLLTEHQRRLYLYIVTLLSGTTDADDILQSVNMLLWSKVDEFRPGTNFTAWAYRIAYYEVLAFRKKRLRDGRLLFSSELMQTITEEQEAYLELERLKERRQALDACLKKLREKDRDLLARRYYAGVTVKDLADETSRPLNSVYRSLDRVRATLLECIQRTLAVKEA